jgi:hypothetical protein
MRWTSLWLVGTPEAVDRLSDMPAPLSDMHAPLCAVHWCCAAMHGRGDKTSGLRPLLAAAIPALFNSRTVCAHRQRRYASKPKCQCFRRTSASSMPVPVYTVFLTQEQLCLMNGDVRFPKPQMPMFSTNWCKTYCSYLHCFQLQEQVCAHRQRRAPNPRCQ